MAAGWCPPQGLNAANIALYFKQLESVLAFHTLPSPLRRELSDAACMRRCADAHGSPCRGHWPRPCPGRRHACCDLQWAG